MKPLTVRERASRDGLSDLKGAFSIKQLAFAEQIRLQQWEAMEELIEAETDPGRRRELDLARRQLRLQVSIRFWLDRRHASALDLLRAHAPIGSALRESG